jgi:hypothetical protein
MAIVKAIVIAHNLQIDVYSEVNKGCEFKIYKSS